MKYALSKIIVAWFIVSVAVAPAYKVHLSSAWYPKKDDTLLASLAHYDHLAAQQYGSNLNGSQLRALVVPHAGYAYSGTVAAAAYRLIPQHFFKRIIILAPSHHVSFSGIGLPDAQYTSYKNVLGSLALDKKVLNALGKNSALCSQQAQAHDFEHAIFVQLPFIQYYCGDQVALVPLLVGNLSDQQVGQVAKMLFQYLDDRTLVLISSDFTHYGQAFSYEPFQGSPDVESKIFQLDSEAVLAIQNQSLATFDAFLSKTQATVCGRNAIRILLELEKQKAFGVVETYVVGYHTSSFGQKNPEHSVSYVSCVVSQQLVNELALEDMLTDYEKKLLLAIARTHIQTLVLHQSKPALLRVPGLLTKALSAKHGAFVTLYKNNFEHNDVLRGCIGTMVGNRPLYQVVYDMAQSAAFKDTRFSALTADELPLITIAISVLTDLQPIASYKDIVVGKDGVVLTKNNHSAVYLPSVATEQGWNLEQLLSSLSQKAGLSAQAWRDGATKYQVFQSCDFKEDKNVV